MRRKFSRIRAVGSGESLDLSRFALPSLEGAANGIFPDLAKGTWSFLKPTRSRERKLWGFAEAEVGATTLIGHTQWILSFCDRFQRKFCHGCTKK